MADLSQTVPSQPHLTENDALNKNLSPRAKPPLLPKPQFAVSNPKNGKLTPVRKVQSSSQTIISVKNVVRSGDIFNVSNHNQISNREETIILNNINIVDSEVIRQSVSEKSPERASDKPPALHPKPKLPPKSNAFKSSRLTKVGSSPNGENSPESPAKTFENSNNSVRGTPVRPPRSPKRILKANPLEEFQVKRPESLGSEFGFSERRQKSASLPRSEFVNWAFREFGKNSAENRQTERKPSEVDFTVEERLSAPKPRPRSKNKPKLQLELDLAENLKDPPSPVYATIDYSKKKTRQIGKDSLIENGLKFAGGNLKSFDSTVDYDFVSANDGECNVQNSLNASHLHNLGDEANNDRESETESWLPYADQEDRHLNACNNNYILINTNYNREPRDEYGNPSSPMMHGEDACSCREESDGIERSPGLAAPQSFLHRYIGTASKHEDERTDEKSPTPDDGKPNNSSFLHKQAAKSALLSPGESPEGFEIVSIDDVEADYANDRPLPNNGAVVENNLTNNAGEVGLPVSRESNLCEKKISECSSRASSCSEGPSLGKRFPWFGSFGKGNKKRTEKKERCASQFYGTPSNLQGNDIINDCSRAKSLPNIKSGDKTVEDQLFERDWNRNAGSVCSEISNLTHNSDGDEDKDSINEVEESDKGKKANKAFLIVKELITSEEVFIDVLRLLNVDFRNFVELRSKDKNNVIPQNNLNKILNHLPELQTLNEVLLSDLKKRIQTWESNPKISDVIVKKGAFLKLYTSYIQNFESQTKHLDECVVKYPKFGKILKEFESLDRCKMLSLKHYMLKPVQRIPQYRLLLSDYLKHIDESSPDYEDTKNALKVVCEVADHVNRNLKHGDRNGMLMHFQSLLSDYELIKPGRELIKDGSLEKICRKTVKDRYFILLNDCLLHTTYSKNSLKIHQELPLSGMKVVCNEDHKHRYGFTVYSITRSFILCAKSETERNEWVQSLQSAIEQYISRQKTFMNVKLPETDTFKIGKEAPVWIQDSKVTMCQICTAEFTSLFRRHHCRACGKVICKNCGGSQAPLQYDSFKVHRVCDQCFPILLKDYEDSEDDIYEILKVSNPDPNQDIQNIYLSNKAKFIKYTSTSKPKFIPPRLKEVSANDTESEMNGLLYRKSRKAWKLHWYVLKEHVLYVYRASEDVKALETIPVLGYEVKHSDVNHENVDKNLIFILEHPHQSPIVFHAKTEECTERWYRALKKASEFEEVSGS